MSSKVIPWYHFSLPSSDTASPRDLHDDYIPAIGDPSRHVRVHNHHKSSFVPPPSRPYDSLSDVRTTFGRKTQFVSSGVTSNGKGSMLVYGSDPGGRPLEFSPAVTLQEKTYAVRCRVACLIVLSIYLFVLIFIIYYVLS